MFRGTRWPALACVMSFVAASVHAEEAPSIESVRLDINIAAPDGEVTLQSEAGSITVDDILGIQQIIADQPAELKPYFDKIAVVTGDVADLKKTADATGATLQGMQDSIGVLQGLQANVTANVNTNTAAIAKANTYISRVQDHTDENLRLIKQLQQTVNLLNVTKEAPKQMRSCRELKASGVGIDGTYTIVPDGVHEMQVYCDMAAGGWTLLGMVHTSSGTSSSVEPNNWFATGLNDANALLAQNKNQIDAHPMAHDPNKFEQYIQDGIESTDTSKKTRLKVVIHAHDDLAMTNTWYKEVPDVNVAKTLFDVVNYKYPSRACRDTQMTDDCVLQNYIGRRVAGFTQFAGMEIRLNGKYGRGVVHMRLLSDAGGGLGWGICSSTYMSDVEEDWKDSVGPTGKHWGNGARIYLF